MPAARAPGKDENALLSEPPLSHERLFSKEELDSKLTSFRLLPCLAKCC